LYDTTTLYGGGLNTIGYNRNWADSYASFGQATVTPPIFGDRLSLTGGMRYTTDHIHTDRNFTCVTALFGPGGSNVCLPANFPVYVPNVTDFQTSVGKDFGGPGAITFTGDASFQWTDNLMTYFRASQGWQSGYANAEVTDKALLNVVDPEKLLTYEAGIKSQWFDNRLRFNVDGFYSDYTDQVINTFRSSATGGVQSTLQNAGKSRFYGVELEATVIPLRGLELNASWAYLDAKFKEFLEQEFTPDGQPVWENPPTNTIPKLVNTADVRPFTLTPEHTITVGGTYTFPPTTAGTFSAHLDMFWSDDFVIFTEPTEFGRATREIHGPAYAVVNGRLRFVDIPLAQGTLELEVFGRNLFDRNYRTFGIDFGDSLGWQGAIFGDPRTFGVGMTYRFTAS
jgi:iron complex outermembrane receptor protein